MGNDIYLMNSDGSGLANLTNNRSDEWAYSPSWSSDGTKIVYVGGEDIISIGSDGTGHVSLTEYEDSGKWAGSPIWSPDGTKIAYELSGDIYVMDSDGSDQTNLTNTAEGVWANYPRWSPNGVYIAYAQHGDIYVMDSDGSDQTNITNSDADFWPWGQTFSPDSLTVLYEGGDEIWAVDFGDNFGVDNINLISLYGELHGSFDYDYARYPRFSPDGSMISLMMDNSVSIIRPDGTELKKLSSVDGYSLEWSPEGSRLTYSGDHDGDIYIINVDGTGETKLVNTASDVWASNAQWSPLPGSVSVVPPPLDWHLERYGEEGDVSLSETGTTATFGLNLWSQPESDAVLSIVSADTGEVTVSPSTLTFTSSNWENIQTITLTGVDDDAEDDTQTTIITVSGVGGFWRSDQETLQVVTADDDATLPSTLTVAFDSGVDGEAWGNGTFSKCASTGSCGALQSGVFSGREVYVKPHANSDDPNDDWYWAYIFKKWDAEAWIMQYVSPALTDSSGEYLWNAHRYSDGENPWGDWGDVTVTAN